MKKLIVSSFAIVIATTAFAQGTVNIGNTPTTTFRTNALVAGGGSGVTSPVAGGFFYEVLTAPSSVTTVSLSLQELLSAPWSDTGLMGTNIFLASGGRMTGPSGAGGIVNNWADGVRQSFIIVGWSSNEGNNWASVAARLQGASFSGGAMQGGTLFAGGYIGATTVQSAISGQVNGLGSFSLFGTTSNAAGTPITTPTDLYLVYIPEPTTLTLAGFSAVILLACRRRR